MTVGTKRAQTLAVIVAALGYFVDIYDLILFSVLRQKSLKGIGITDPDALLDRGVLLIDMQMGGMLIGGILWGILGDKRGRLSVLFGSILLYSIANIANGFATNVETYALLRFLAGVGLAGELGAGITLVSESMHKDARGYGTMIVATIGILGAVVAVLVGDNLPWQHAYFVGGGLGLALLLLRIGVYESGMFSALKEKKVARGDFFSLFTTKDRAKRYFSVIAIGVPIWYVVGVLVTYCPEIGKAMGMSAPPEPGRAVMFCYVGLAIGDFVSGGASQVFKSRRKVLGAFLALTALGVALYFSVGKTSLDVFYGVCFFLGLATGYWAVFVTVASEQFGTNVRATATTTAPNFVRGAVVPMTLLFQAWKRPFGIVGSAASVGALTLVLAAVSLFGIGETYGRDLDFVES